MERLCSRFVKFLRTRLPLDPQETLDLDAFMEATDESLRQDEVLVDVATAMARS